MLHEACTSENFKLAEIFSQPTTVYIPKAIARRVVEILLEIKERQIDISPTASGLLTEKEWFCFLVDSTKLIAKFGDLLINGLAVSMYSMRPTLFTIVVYGEKKEDEFFRAFLDAFSTQEYPTGMNESIARKLVKYYGEVAIYGRMDCAHLTAGNDNVGEVVFSTKYKSEFISTESIKSVSGNDLKTVAPHIQLVSEDTDVAFIEVHESVSQLELNSRVSS
jgi:hypothetical protein